MATIERKPLPPPNAKVTAITEADRADIIARANDVIDYYLNGPGSYFDSGTQKPLVGEYGDNAVADLNNFKNSIIASKQFADDPHSIMQSVVDLIDRTIEQVEKAAQYNEGRESISLPPPDTNDPIRTPEIKSNSALPVLLPIGVEQPAPSPQADVNPVRRLVRLNGSMSPAVSADPSSEGFIPRSPNSPASSLSAPAATLVPSGDSSFAGGLLGRMPALLGVKPQKPDQLASPPQDDDLRAFYRDPAQQRTLQRLR